MKSKFLSLNWNDFLKGLLMAFLGALVTGIYQLFQTGSALNWATLKPVLLVAIANGLSYLIKNLFTNNQGEFAKLDKK
jgi:lysozyme family protein